MTVDAQPDAEPINPADYGFTVLERDTLPSELLTLVERVRGLVDAVAHTEADAAELAAAGQAVTDLTERLTTRRRQVGTLFSRVRSDGGTEYGTLANSVSGPLNPIAPPLELRADGEGVFGEVTLPGVYEGPPGCVHGGWLAALLDQAVGDAVGRRGILCMTGNLNVDYRKPTPLNAPLTIAARVTGTERRKVFVSGEIRHNGTVTAECTAIMVQLVVPDS